MTTEESKLINTIADRIKTEREKHLFIDWEIFAAQKIYDTLITYWQEKTRWKSLKTEPPKFEGQKYQILVRYSSNMHDVACIGGLRSVENIISAGYKDWKEIE